VVRARARGGDGVDIGHAERRFDDQLEPDPLFAADGGLALRHQHVDGVDVGGRADLRDHDQVQPLAALLDDLDQVTVHVVRVQPVDAH